VDDKELTVADVVHDAVARSYARLVANEPGLWLGRDPEAVHQARVAVRRLRSDLRTFEDFLERDWSGDLRAELKWLGAELGIVRDQEVMRDRLRDHTRKLPHTEADTARRVVRRLDADREGARRDLLAMLGEPRYARLRRSLDRAAQHPQCNYEAKQHARQALAPVVRARYKKLENDVKRLTSDPPDEALHAVRIRAKRCRYACEASVAAFGKPAARLAEALADVQDVLGEHQDAVVAIAWLNKTAHECSAAEAFAVGMLAQVERDTARESRAAFPASWKRARQSHLRAWLWAGA
jgi:CHAD domain-containing protein